MFFQLVVVLLAIYFGARIGGIGVGGMGGAGLIILTFFFGVIPTSPPIDVLLIIASVIAASSALQASGGMDYLVQIAENMIKKYPPLVTFVAPFVTFFFTVFTGTGMTAFSVMPVIVEVAKKANVRPEAPLTMAAVASQVAITAAPISAAVVGFHSLIVESSINISLISIIMVTIPSLLLAIMVTAFITNYFSGKLSDDPIYQQRLKAGQIQMEASTSKVKATRESKIAVFLFLLTLLSVVLIASLQWLPAENVGGRIHKTRIADVIQMFMLACAGLILVLSKAKAVDAVKGSVFKAGMTAVVAVMGIAWLGDSFFKAHIEFIRSGLGDIAMAHPWSFSLILFVMSWFLYSQAATTFAVMPLGIALNIPVPYLIAMFPAVSGLFVIPNYPTVVAAIEFDDTGTTRIGKYLFNHSFMLPGIMVIGLGILFGFVFQYFIF